MQRLRLANRRAWAASDRIRALLIDAIVIVLSFGMLGGMALNPLLSWFGRPLMDRVPLWFTVLCGLLSVCILAGQWFAEHTTAE
jgi:hypothetical protein